MANYITRQGDQVDYICWKYYGTDRSGVVERVLEDNPGLAGFGHTLPAGINIVLPDITLPEASAEPIRLWD